MSVVESQADREKQFNMHEALAKYRATDTTVPIGGLSPQAYESVLVECAEAKLTAEQMFDLAWVQLEYAMAIMRSDLNYATKRHTRQEKLRLHSKKRARCLELFTNIHMPLGF